MVISAKDAAWDELRATVSFGCRIVSSVEMDALLRRYEKARAGYVDDDEKTEFTTEEVVGIINRVAREEMDKQRSNADKVRISRLAEQFRSEIERT